MDLSPKSLDLLYWSAMYSTKNVGTCLLFGNSCRLNLATACTQGKRWQRVWWCTVSLSAQICVRFRQFNLSVRQLYIYVHKLPACQHRSTHCQLGSFEQDTAREPPYSDTYPIAGYNNNSLHATEDRLSFNSLVIFQN